MLEFLGCPVVGQQGFSLRDQVISPISCFDFDSIPQ
jgi:hypothetical protein